MLSFSQYQNQLLEGTNLHLTHVEDLIFDKGAAGVIEIVEFLEGMHKLLAGHADRKYNLTVKYDGAPAVFCGTHPETGKFFVGTKSVFNKTPKINYTTADIKANHSGGLVNILITALEVLPSLGIKGVVQGDILFVKDHIKAKVINGEKLLTFTPNTITYAVPADSKLAKEIRAAKMGVAFHTKYTGKTWDKMSASFGVSISGYKKTKSVFVVDAAFDDVSGVANFSKKETDRLEASINKIKGQASKINVSKEFAPDLNRFFNQLVRKGTTGKSGKALFGEFSQFVSDDWDKQISKLKSEAGKERKQVVKTTTLANISKNKNDLVKAFELHAVVAGVKQEMIDKLNKVGAMKHFVKSGDGYEVTNPEGFVAIDHLGTNAIKLVDRLEFSRNNFNLEKSW